MNLDFFKTIYFFNIGNNHNDENYFHWSTNIYHKSSFFLLKLIKNTPKSELFYCISNPDIKIVYYSADNIIFSIGAKTEVQSILLEAALEYLRDEFLDMYDESLLTTCYGDSCEIFSGFTSVVEDLFRNFTEKDLVEAALVQCKGCGKTQKVIIKKSLILNSKQTNTPIVYVHSGHALLIYIDKQFKVRGSQLVSVSY
ncbi:MAG: hypothetical protein EU548_09590 [Promethearchaeota archaeon]|nr:MAG: hypothetical protein EU548_09590 [Candidatus Lokiarchaeota archaeon]